MEDEPAAHDTGKPPRFETDVERARRIEALKGLAGTASPDSVDASPGHLNRHIIQAGTSRQRVAARLVRWLAPAAGLLVIRIVVVTMFFRPQTAPTGGPSMHPTATPIPDPLVIALGKPGTLCAGQAAWSPDGTEVAVATFSSCGPRYLLPGASRPLPSGPAAGASLTIYSALTGNRVSSLDLSIIVSDMVPAGASDDPAASSHYALIFSGLVWARDGQETLVSIISALVSRDVSTITPDQLFSEKLIASGASGDSYIFSLPQQFTRHPDTSSAYLWDIHGRALSVVSLPPALAYTWNAQDILNPSQALGVPPAATPGPPTGVIGYPGGDSSFTTWQQGVIARPCTSPPGQAASGCCVPSNYVAGSFGTAASWSPDVRYAIVPEVGIVGASGALMAPSSTGIPNSCPPSSVPNDQPILPVRDAGLAAAIAALPPSAGASAYVAWNASGLRLATVSGGEATDEHLSVYDCKSGKLLTDVPLAALEQLNVQRVAFAPPQWSQDEQRIMVLDLTNQVIMILGHKTLHL